MGALTGKTNARHIRVFMDDYGATPTARDISACVSSISGVGLDYDEQDVTAYSDGVINFVLGHPDSSIDMSGPFNNTALTGAHVVFTRIVGGSVTKTLTVQIGIKAAPETGVPEFEGEYICTSYTIKGDGTWSARLRPYGSTAPAWGTMS